MTCFVFGKRPQLLNHPGLDLPVDRICFHVVCLDRDILQSLGFECIMHGLHLLQPFRLLTRVVSGLVIHQLERVAVTLCLQSKLGARSGA